MWFLPINMKKELSFVMNDHDHDEPLSLTGNTKVLTDAKTIRVVIMATLAITISWFSFKASSDKKVDDAIATLSKAVDARIDSRIGELTSNFDKRLQDLNTSDAKSTELILAQLKQLEVSFTERINATENKMLKRQETSDIIYQLKLQNIADKLETYNNIQKNKK
jgi:hypothetical protein